jgi:hypothetical protein
MENAKSLVVVRAEGLPFGITEAVRDSSVFDGWSTEDRQRVETLYAAALEQLHATPGEAGIMVAPDGRAASLVQSTIAELVRSGEADCFELADGVVEATYDNHDAAGWAIGMARGLLKKVRRRKFRWIAPPEQPDRVPDDPRIAVLGDWGTGMYGAPVSARTINDDAEGFDTVVHLGDVYYSGTDHEVDHNFIAYWPRPHARRSETVLARACNSNHEMYSGGTPYARRTLRFLDQTSSVFAFENEHWLFVGLDTAFVEWSLYGDQVQWLSDLLARDDGRRVVLFSHHQPFSHFSQPRASLFGAIAPTLQRFPSKVVAWYWGHEHLCVLYDRHPRLGFYGRCAGHSGFPYFRPGPVRSLQQTPPVDPRATAWTVHVPEGDAPAAFVVDGPNPFVSRDAATQARYGPNGHLTLQCDRASIHETVHDPAGIVLWEHTLSL